MKFIKENKAFIFSILSIALPVIVEMSLVTLVGIADTLMVSHFLGKEALSGAGFANQIVFTTIFVFSAFNVGTTVIVSRSHGENNLDRLNRVVEQNLKLNVIIGVMVTVLTTVFARNILSIFDTTQNVLDMGLSYLKIVASGQIFMFISFAGAASLRGVEDTKTPMIISGIVNILNVIGNYILITGFWIFPEMGIEGAALSTVISRGVGALLYIVALTVKGNGRIRLKINNLKLSADILKPLWKFSSNAAIEQALMQTAAFCMSLIISLLDTTSEAAFRILLSIESTSVMPAVGVSIACSVLVGKALGEKDADKVVRTAHISLGLGTLWGGIIGVVFVLFPDFILSLFSSEHDIIRESVSTLRLAGIDQPFLAFSIILSGALRGTGDTRAVMAYTSARQWLLFVPLTYIFVVYAHMGTESVWVAELIAMCIFNLLMFRRLSARKWAKIEI